MATHITKSTQVLVVDDDAMNRELMEAVLETVGFKAILTNSVDSAWQVLEENLPNLPAAALVDVRLQGVRDGYKLTRRIKEDPRLASIKVAIITALEDDAERHEASEAGADIFISRMAKMNDIINQLKMLLGH